MKLVVQGPRACHANEIGTEQHKRDICLSAVWGEASTHGWKGSDLNERVVVSS